MHKANKLNGESSFRFSAHKYYVYRDRHVKKYALWYVVVSTNGPISFGGSFELYMRHLSAINSLDWFDTLHTINSK